MSTINPTRHLETDRQSLNERFEAMLHTMAAERARRGKLKALTLCSGIEAQAEAIRRVEALIEVVATAEVGVVPSAVIAARHPNTVNLGDVTAPDFCRRAMEVSPCGYDLVFASTPCQAFSLAGLRKGLDDDRGALTPHVIKIVNELNPSIYMWENVLGALSDRTNAFGCMLGALVGADEPLTLPKGCKWPNFGAATGPLRSAAWRVLDARHFGVPQRRRRVFLTATTHTSAIDPRSIVFETL